MTNQQTSQPQSSDYLENRKVQKLLERIERKLALQAKAASDKAASTSKN
jgi:hypothetical protein